MNNERKKIATPVRGAGSTANKSAIRRRGLATAATKAVGRLLSGDGWTTAVTLDDAFAPELLQTWSLQDEDESDEDGEADTRIVDPDNAPVFV